MFEALILAASAALAWALVDLFVGLSSRSHGAVRTAFLLHAVGLPAALAIAFLVRPPVFGGDVVAGLAAGALVALGDVAFNVAFTASAIAVIAPLVGVLTAAIPICYALATGERLSGFEAAGMACAAAAVALSPHAAERGASVSRRDVALGVLAAAAFGVALIVLAHTKDASGSVAFAGERLAATAVLLPLAVRSARRAAAGLRAGFPCFGVGAAALSVFGNLAYARAAHGAPSGLVAIVAVAMSAPLTTLMATVFLRERLSPRQWAGIASAVAGVFFLTARG